MQLSKLLNPREIFLLDGIGATLSFGASGIVLPLFSSFLGIPPWLFYGLAAIAFFYGCFSFTVYFFTSRCRPEFLLAIIIGNISYCFLSVGLILFWDSATFLGKILFASEALIVFLVAFFEIQVFRKSRCS